MDALAIYAIWFMFGVVSGAVVYFVADILVTDGRRRRRPW